MAHRGSRVLTLTWASRERHGAGSGDGKTAQHLSIDVPSPVLLMPTPAMQHVVRALRCSSTAAVQSVAVQGRDTLLLADRVCCQTRR